jgi:hypothetical protein
MLSPIQIEAIKDKAVQIADPLTDFLLQDIARRISRAGQLTSTASYQVWRAQQLGLSQRQIKQWLRDNIKLSHRDIRKLLTQSARVGYDFDIKNLPYVQAVQFADNVVIMQTVSAAIEMAQSDFTNITQTLGMVDPFGNALPLQDVYRKTMDFAFEKVFTGATDYNTAIRQATANLAKYGVRTIDYKTGVHRSIEAATRLNIMGATGTMANEINAYNHDALGCNGWEISAHAACAPDHIPIQGRQYSDAEYQKLNESLVRHIGTLNCGHMAFPIILGVSSPQYTNDDLEKMQTDNKTGVDYQGKHYTTYQATQQQRALERSIRLQKRRVTLSEGTGDTEQQQISKTRLTLLNQEYRRFSKAAGLPMQNERNQVAGIAA